MSSSARGVRFGLKKFSTGFPFLGSTELADLWLFGREDQGVVEVTIFFAEDQGTTIGSLVIGLRSPRATP
jgi:hypothetical protein